MTEIDDHHSVDTLRSGDLEKILVNVVRQIDPKHHVDGTVIQLLQSLPIKEAHMPIAVEGSALLSIGYETITLFSTLELGKQLLRKARTMTDTPDYNGVLDRVVDSAYNWIISDVGTSTARTVPNLTYSFDLLQFAREEGRPVELDMVWYVPETSKELARIEKSEQRPGKGAVRLNFALNLKVLKDLQDADAISHYMLHKDSEIVDMVRKAKQIGVSIQPEDIAGIGYANLLQGRRVEYALRLVKIAEKLGARIDPVVSALATKYQELQAAQQSKA